MKTLFIIILISVTLIACGQEGAYTDLPEKTTTSGADGLTIMSGGSPYRMSNSTLFNNVNDSIGWIADTSRSHTDRIATLEAGGGGGSFWSKTGTDLSPATGGDNILMPSTDATYYRASTGAYNSINSDAINQLNIYAGGNAAVDIISNTSFNINSTSLKLYGTQFIPSSNHAKTIGSNTAYWSRGYVDTVYLYDNSTKLYRDVSNNLTFEDAVTGNKSLAELASGGSDLGDTITTLWEAVMEDTVPIGDVVRLLADSTLLWSWDFTDSAQFHNDRWMTKFFHAGPDTLAIEGVRAGCEGSAPNFSWNICYNDSIGFTADYTKLWTTELVVTGTDATTVGEVDVSPNNPSIPSDNWVFLYLNNLTAKPSYGCSFNVYGHEF